MRPISSTISAPIDTSARQDGIFTFRFCPLPETPKPNDCKIDLIFCGLISAPNKFVISVVDILIARPPIRRAAPTETMPFNITPLDNSAIMAAAWSSASSVAAGSKPFSNRAELSLRKPRILDVLRTATGSKIADSKITVLVSLVTPLSFPPITPAIATGCFSSAITNIESSRL